jgi:hypothetical protein
VRNTATGAQALNHNTTGHDNTATGTEALFTNTIGRANTANGYQALYFNSEGIFNTADGFRALYENTGDANTAIGDVALANNTTGSDNTAVGIAALNQNTTGSGNIAIGDQAGLNITGNGNVCIGHVGVADVDDTTWIANVYESVATARQVYVDLGGKLGTLSSSRRYKEEVKPMSAASEALFALKPVTFRYKKQIDHTRALSFGLIAEEVAEISPDLITCDEEGNPQTVRYEAINAMLLNEFLKEHRKVEKQEATIAQLKKEMETVVVRLKEQDSKIQKVSDQLELRKPAPQVVINDP